MRNRFKIIPVVLILILCLGVAYHFLNIGELRPAAVSLHSAEVAQPKDQPTSAPANMVARTVAAPTSPPVPPSSTAESAPYNGTDGDAMALKNSSGQIASLLQSGDFATLVQLYIHPADQAATQKELENLLKERDGPARLQLMVTAFNSLDPGSVTHNPTGDKAALYDQTIYHDTLPGGPNANRIPIIFDHEGDHWYLDPSAFGVLYSTTHNVRVSNP